MALGPLLSIFLTFMLYDYSISNMASQVTNDFKVQNANELGSGDIFGLINRLNRIAASEHIVCATAQIDDKNFFERKNASSCDHRILFKTGEVISTGTKIRIQFLIKLPWNWQLAFVMFLILQLVNLASIIYLLTRSYISRIQIAGKFMDLAKQAAHDIRSPLGALNMTIHSLQEVPRVHAEIIASAIERINTVADELLLNTNTSISDNRLPFQDLQKKKLEEIRDREFVVNIASEIYQEKSVIWKDKSNINFVFDNLIGPNESVLCRPQDLKRILSNILNNAFEALPVESGIITLGLRDAHSQVMIYVLDTGKGMTPEVLAALGSRGFSRGKEKNLHAGSGLGVSHAKETIEKWGGTLKVQSKVGEGTIVEIRLNKPK
jgi:signal transduction histidine kinase